MHNTTNELYHYGVKGMKWRRRKNGRSVGAYGRLLTEVKAENEWNRRLNNQSRNTVVNPTKKQQERAFKKAMDDYNRRNHPYTYKIKRRAKKIVNRLSRIKISDLRK